MAAPPTHGVYPMNRTKTIHLVRHGQGIHNVAGEVARQAAEAAEAPPNETAEEREARIRAAVHAVFLLEAYADAHLTPLGWEQVDDLRRTVRENGISKKVELVAVSPLLRTLQTAAGVFGGVDTPLLMTAGAGNSNRPAIPSSNCPPFIANESCREQWGLNPCDRRSNITRYNALFPAIDFSLIASDEDEMWQAGVRETVEHVEARGKRFMKWLFTRPEKVIAVVTHDGFLHHILPILGHDSDAPELSPTSRFRNCEIRSFVLVDKYSRPPNVPVHAE